MTDLLGRYPVRNVQDMETACNYFVGNKDKFNSYDRRQYAFELNSIMKTAGVDVPPIVSQYVGGPRESISDGIAYRRLNTNAEHHSRLESIEKIAEYETPSEVMEMLDKFDIDTGLNRRYDIIPDPALTVFGQEKVADFSDDVWSGDTDRLRRSEFENWVQSSEYYNLMKNHFPIDMVNEIRSNPWPIFQSLPDPHKNIISRMCNDRSIGMRPAGQSMYDSGGATVKEQLHQPADRRLKDLETFHLDNKSRILSRLKRD